MNDQRSSENWELEEGGEADDRWVLEESEQRLTDQWQLEDDRVEDVGEWQPVEYQRQRRAGPTWILPSIITVALLGVIGYSAWTLVPRIFGEATSTPPVEDPTVVSLGVTPTAKFGEAEETTLAEGEPVVVASTGSVTAEPSTPPPPPTATPSPMPPIVNQDFATVTSTYGVNARIAPTTDAEIIRILEQSETFFILEQRDEGWLEIFVIEPGTELGPDQPVVGRVGYAAAEYFAIAKQPLLEEFANEILIAAGRAPTPEPTVPPPTEVSGATEETGTLPTVTPITEEQEGSPTTPPTVTVAAPVSVTIDVPYGLNVRVQPNLASDIVSLLENGATVPAVSRYVDNKWVQVALGDGAQGWLFVEFTIIEGDLNSLPLTSTGELPAATASPTPTPTPEVATETEAVEPPAPFTSTLPADSPAIIVPSINGVNARSAPRSDAEVIAILPQNAALPARARSTDEQWVQVELPDGTMVWVFRGAVVATSDVSTLPMVDETDATAQPAPTASPTPASAGDAPAEDDTAETAPEVVAVVTVRSIVLAVYPEPDLTLESIAVAARGNDLPALGRTAAGDWIQVQTKSGATGWVNASAVALNVDTDTLPVVQ